MNTAQALPAGASREDFLKELARLKDGFEKARPVLEVTVRDPEIGVEGFVVVHNTAISLHGPLHGQGQGCGKGGTRITPDVTLDDVRMLAQKMALKNAAAGLPLGGSKSALCADPDAPGFEAKYRRFVELCKPFLFVNGGVFGGFGFDIGARPVHAIWACEAAGTRRCFTGKPLDMGGTDYDREGIAGLGVAVAARAALEYHGDAARGARFAVQGAGAMGAAVIRYFSSYGGVLAAVSDPRLGGGWELRAAPSEALIAALSCGDMDAARPLLAHEGKPLDRPEDILTYEADILFPCAVQNVLHADNAAKVKAKMVVEGANSPCTADAYNIFHDMGILAIPDFIANPGGVIAAFVEMTMDVPDAENAKTKAKTAQAKHSTEKSIDANVKALLDLTRAYDVRPVDAGMYIALSRIG